MDGEGLSTESTFYDDHYVLDTTKKRWKRRDALQDPDLPPPPPRAWDRKALQASLVAVSLTPPPRIGACCAVAGKVLYVLGGTLEVGDTKELALDDVWCLDVAADAWTRVKTNSGFGPRNAHVLCRLRDGGFVVNGGWKPFVSTYDDTLRLEVDSS